MNTNNRKKMTAKEICATVDPRTQDAARVLADQVILISQKLKSCKKDIKEQKIVIEYDNGGGQKGVRENPTFIAYEKLLGTFTRSLTALQEIIGEKAEDRSKIEYLDKMRGAAMRLVK